MRPCDCESMYDCDKFLDHSGISNNDRGITVEPASVIIKMGHTTLRVPQRRFKQWAEWYLEDQEKK